MLRRHRVPLLTGLLLAIGLALAGRGGLFHMVGSLYLLGLAVLGALAIWAGSRLLKRDGGALAVAVGLVGAAQLLSLPLGAAVNRWDVQRARAWCERTAPLLAGRSAAEVEAWVAENGAPVLGGYMGTTCAQADRTSMMRWWEYDLAAGAWREVD